LALATVAAPAGCTRTLYRRQADREANYLVREKSVGTPWEVPDDYTIQPDPRSRFFDPTDPDFPTLPPAGPQLYQYKLPELNSSRRGKWEPEPLPETLPANPQSPSPELPAPPPIPELNSVPSGPAAAQRNPASAQTNAVPWAQVQPPYAVQQASSASHVGTSHGGTPAQQRGGEFQLLAYQEQTGAPAPAKARKDPFEEFINTIGRAQVKVKGLEVPSIQSEYWENIPPNCLALMLDFERVRNEYVDTYGVEPSDELRDKSPRLTLEELFELALIDSREYQRRKEILYEAALNVSLERFAYATKFSLRGTTVDTTYSHLRSRGTTVNTLAVPSTFRGDKVLATGGTLVGQFANDILLTFNGPTGFAADVSSELLFEITQRVIRRDILLEPLIQSERNLIYAARDFMRFRKEFFLQIADSYYRILINYRRIEISAQNYFAQVRTFQQALEEVESGVSSAPNVIFLNEFERSALSALVDLIGVCNSFEQSLDSFKLTLGVPTETVLNVDLEELVQLTLRDTIEVSKAQALRWLTRLEKLRSEASEATQGDILTADYSLAEQLIKWLWERGRLVENKVDPREVFQERELFRLDAARLEYLSDRQLLAEAQTSDPPKQRILVFQNQVDVIESELAVIGRQIEYADSLGLKDRELDQDRAKWEGIQQQFEDLLTDIDKALETNPDDRAIIELIDVATRVLAEADTLAQDLDRLLFGQVVERLELANTLAKTDQLIELARSLFDEADGGLPPIDISVDEAMVTALVQRLDLMNQRGFLADDWRAIKIAADELKSNLNISASQRVNTDTNRPFSFSTDNANTRLRLAWDLPLNRKLQRNAFRRSLINYNVGLRDLMQTEDRIKFNVRSQLRNLAQARLQYPLFVDQAALAEEQVVSTRLQLILGIPNVRARDLLDALNSARVALGRMVDARIGYITERALFALELEIMMLDDEGFWPQINDPSYQPQANGAYPWNAGSAYGSFPSYLKVSNEFRRMLNQPPPGASGTMRREDAREPDPADTPPASEPAG
jgi:hypothetical protein